MARSVLVAGVSAIVLLGGAGPATAVPSAPTAPTAYYANIPAGAPGYRPDGGQVAVVPVGAAPTGDGSRADVVPEVTEPEDGPVTPSVAWWWALGLVLITVGTLRTRPARPASRR
ncbi:hypothetical protein [Actinomycetospora straminea]|uniref:MYXO-CTERM domain-containing protein n=1 Tax=Actinomycetospora straminea TaxID=663607 RepID=A0ABP9DRY7_9PSEU|nr:hypothetical protein [Actinomycetospora straminea]MDD7935845.1 hypothetical protein [Actinomycetospora straminea]